MMQVLGVSQMRVLEPGDIQAWVILLHLRAEGHHYAFGLKFGAGLDIYRVRSLHNRLDAIS